MSNIETLTIICAGTEMRWDQDFGTQLGFKTTQRTNLPREGEYPKQVYFCLDGPATKPTPDHPVPSSIKFNPSATGYIEGHTKEVWYGKKIYDWLFGGSMQSNTNAACDLVKHLTATGQKPKRIKLVGYSRGGTETFKIANALFNDKETSKIPVDILAIDPVPGPGHEGEKDVIQVSANVETCTVLLATNESLLGFEPQDSTRLKFQSETTKRVFLTFPDDHLTILSWVKSLVKRFIGAEHPVYIGEKELIDNEVINQARDDKRYYDKNRALRVKQLQKNREIYQREFDENDPKTTVETYYQWGFKSHNPLISLLIDTGIPVEKFFSEKFRSLGLKRRVSQDKKHYTNHPFFDNLHHELAFSQAYPNFYNWIMGDFSILDSPKELKETEKYNYIKQKYSKIFDEYAKMPFHTKKFIARKLDLFDYNKRNFDSSVLNRIRQIENKLRTKREKIGLNYATNISSSQQILDILSCNKSNNLDQEGKNHSIQDAIQLLEHGVYELSMMAQRSERKDLYKDTLELRKIVKDIKILVKNFPNHHEEVIKTELEGFLKDERSPEVIPLIKKSYEIINTNAIEDKKKEYLNKHLIRLKKIEGFVNSKLENVSKKIKALQVRQQRYGSLQTEYLKFQDKIEILQNKLDRLDQYFNALKQYHEIFDNIKSPAYLKMSFIEMCHELKKAELIWLQDAKNIVKLTPEERKAANINLGSGLGSASTPKVIDKVWEELSYDSFNKYVKKASTLTPTP